MCMDFGILSGRILTFLEPVELLVLDCFAPGLFDNPSSTASPQSTSPLWGSCLRPGVLLDCVMGQWSSLAILLN